MKRRLEDLRKMRLHVARTKTRSKRMPIMPQIPHSSKLQTTHPTPQNPRRRNTLRMPQVRQSDQSPLSVSRPRRCLSSLSSRSVSGRRIRKTETLSHLRLRLQIAIHTHLAQTQLQRDGSVSPALSSQGTHPLDQVRADLRLPSLPLPPITQLSQP